MTQQESVEIESHATRLVILRDKERKEHLIEIEGQSCSLRDLVKDLAKMIE